MKRRMIQSESAKGGGILLQLSNGDLAREGLATTGELTIIQRIGARVDYLRQQDY
jgi:hypothetical protein